MLRSMGQLVLRGMLLFVGLVGSSLFCSLNSVEEQIASSLWAKLVSSLLSWAFPLHRRRLH